MSLRVENQKKYKDHPIIKMRTDFNYATDEPEGDRIVTNQPNAGDVIGGILDNLGEYINQGQAIADVIEGNSSVQFGEDVTITPNDANDNKTIWGMPRPLVIAGGVTILVVGTAITIALVVSHNKKKKATAVLN